MTSNTIKISHVRTDRELQCNLIAIGIERGDANRIAVTLGARHDVWKAWIGANGFLHVLYLTNNLKGTKYENFVASLSQAVVQVIEHKLEVIAKNRSAALSVT